MANSLGSLVVSLGLNAAEFISGMTKSELQAKRFGQALDRSIAVGVVKAELALRALGAAVRTTAAVFQSLTVDAGNFKDLEESTGAVAEDLASLAVSAATAGVEMDSVAAAANKLTKGLVGVDDESKATGAALKALNLNISDFKQLDPVAQYEAVGKALAGFADGAGKVAIAQALFGKSGAEQLKVFKALEEAGGRQTILTQRQIEMSDAFNDQQAKARAELKLYAQAAASEAVPALTALVKGLTDAAKAALNVDAATGKIAANNGVRQFAEQAATAIAGLVGKVILAGKAIYALGGSFQSVAADATFAARAAAAAALPTPTNLIAAKDAFDERQKMAAEANQRYIDLFNYDSTRLAKSV